MCKPLTEGGQRCAAHTRPDYEAAAVGTQEWDRAAAAHASTPSGAAEIAAFANKAIIEGRYEEAVAARAAERIGTAKRLAATHSAERIRAAGKESAVPVPADPATAEVVTKTVVMRREAWDADSVTEFGLTPAPHYPDSFTVTHADRELGTVRKYGGATSRSVAGTRLSSTGRERTLWAAQANVEGHRWMFGFNSRADAIRFLCD